MMSLKIAKMLKYSFSFIQYFSIGSEKSAKYCSEELKETTSYLEEKIEKNFIYHNDGLFGYDEIEW